MLHKTRGIVLKTTLYGDTSVIVQVFTEKFGIQSYLINGVRKPKAKIGMNMLQPLHLIDMVVYHKPGSNLQRLREARPSPVLRSIPYDVIKSTMTIFLNEVLYKSIRQQSADEHLFEFIYNAVCWFDECGEASVNFHLSFLLKLSRFLGFAPHAQARNGDRYFDLQEGEFRSAVPVHPNYLEQEDALLFISLYTLPFERITEIRAGNKLRRHLLEKILVYFRLHTASFGDIRSHQVLEEVLS